MKIYQDNVLSRHVFIKTVFVSIFESEEGRGGRCLLRAIRWPVPCELGKSLNLENGVIAFHS